MTERQVKETAPLAPFLILGTDAVPGHFFRYALLRYRGVSRNQRLDRTSVRRNARMKIAHGVTRTLTVFSSASSSYKRQPRRAAKTFGGNALACYCIGTKTHP